MTAPKLTVLDGGKSLPVSEMHRVFLSAYVTDTRLMGVLAICAHWSIVPPGAARKDPESWEELHQFIYIDCEEAGLETYQQVRGDDPQEVARLETAMICGLGAEKIELNERQLRLLLQDWQKFNEKHGLPMPEGIRDYGFLLEPRLSPSLEEQYDLMRLICAPITTDVQLINYFLMRCFGRDYEGARFLTPASSPEMLEGEAGKPLQDDFPLDIYDKYIRATFCRNVIDKKKTYGDGATEYLCESLIEMDGSYDLVVSKVVVRDLKVIGLEHCSGFPVSEAEAAMMLKKPEFVTVYEIFLSDEELENNIDEFTLGFQATMSECENGRLFMTFRKNNAHVGRRIFQLSNDVKGLYFLSEHNQLILCAYSLRDIRQLELSIAQSVLAPYLIPSARYEFREPVLYEFMQSDFEHFEDFLELLRGE